MEPGEYDLAALAHLEAGPHAEAAVWMLETMDVDGTERELVEALTMVRRCKMMVGDAAK